MRRVVLLSAATALVLMITACGQGVDHANDGVRSAEAATAGSLPVTDTRPGHVPVTLTMPAAGYENNENPVTKVRIAAAKDSVYTRPASGREQYLLGYVSVTEAPIELLVEYWLAGAANPSPRSPTVQFATTSHCEGDIERIACAVTTGPQANRLVCSATYDSMNNPDPICIGTYACKRCLGGVRICGENPQCQ